MLNMALQRVRIFADDVSELASISREDNNIIIRAEDNINACRSSERIAIQNDDTTLPADFVIGFKHSTLREMISCTDADNLIMKFDNKTMPITITEEDKESQLFILVMPMLINQ
jgi:DNA polymerase III sliding clamp (beta) subunit (PCNA family)